jgi:hypothetical protein
MHAGAAREHVEKLIREHLLFMESAPRVVGGTVKERSWEEVG